MNLLRPLIAGIATGIGLRIGGDLYDKFKNKADASGSDGSFNPFRKNQPVDAEATVTEAAE